MSTYTHTQKTKNKKKRTRKKKKPTKLNKINHLEKIKSPSRLVLPTISVETLLRVLNQQKERKGNARAGKKEIVCYQRTINCSQSKSKWWSSSFIYSGVQLSNQRNVVLAGLKENCTFCFGDCPLDLEGFHWISFTAHCCTLERQKEQQAAPRLPLHCQETGTGLWSIPQIDFVVAAAWLVPPPELQFLVVLNLLH